MNIFSILNAARGLEPETCVTPVSHDEATIKQVVKYQIKLFKASRVLHGGIIKCSHSGGSAPLILQPERRKPIRGAVRMSPYCCLCVCVCETPSVIVFGNIKRD